MRRCRRCQPERIGLAILRRKWALLKVTLDDIAEWLRRVDHRSRAIATGFI